RSGHARRRHVGAVVARRPAPAAGRDGRRTVDGVNTIADTSYLAALARLDLATVSRLRVLLSRHDAAEAWAVASGRHPPHPAVAPMVPTEPGAAVRADA